MANPGFEIVALAASAGGLHAITEVATRSNSRPRVLAMEWLDPPYTAGHWVPDLGEF